MMTPKQKAKELFEKFLSLIPVAESCSKCSRISEAHEGARISQAKECAIICASEVLNEIPMYIGYLNQRYVFWAQVRQEIEKL